MFFVNWSINAWDWFSCKENPWTDETWNQQLKLLLYVMVEELCQFLNVFSGERSANIDMETTGIFAFGYINFNGINTPWSKFRSLFNFTGIPSCSNKIFHSFRQLNITGRFIFELIRFRRKSIVIIEKCGVLILCSDFNCISCFPMCTYHKNWFRRRRKI